MTEKQEKQKQQKKQRELENLKEKFIDKWSNWWVINDYPQGQLTKSFKKELNNIIKKVKELK